MRKEALEERINDVVRILASRQRCQGYVTLKLKKILPQLRRAIEKIEEGTYGLCDDCDGKIPAKRLNAVPGATRCVACQNSKEVCA